jgi:hypothetical protein
VTRRPEFSAVSSQMAQIKPSSTAMTEYTPTATTHSLCSSIFTLTGAFNPEHSVTSTTVVHFATILPSKPDLTLCNCMIESLGCIQSSEAFQKDNEPGDNRPYQDDRNATVEASLHDKFCFQNETWCLGSTSNVTVGRYGAYIGCNGSERVSWTMNQLYRSRGNDTAACTSAGGIVRTPVKSPSGQCISLLSQAGPDGTGVVHQTQWKDATLREGDKSRHGINGSSAKAGIGVGVATLVLLAAAIFLLCRSRLRKKKSLTVEPNFEKPEMPDTSISLPQEKHYEIDGNERLEIPGAQVLKGDHGVITEMPTVHNEPVELEAIEGSKYEQLCT